MKHFSLILFCFIKNYCTYFDEKQRRVVAVMLLAAANNQQYNEIHWNGHFSLINYFLSYFFRYFWWLKGIFIRVEWRNRFSYPKKSYFSHFLLFLQNSLYLIFYLQLSISNAAWKFLFCIFGSQYEKVFNEKRRMQKF